MPELDHERAHNLIDTQLAALQKNDLQIIASLSELRGRIYGAASVSALISGLIVAIISGIAVKVF